MTKDMKYNVDSIKLTEEELVDCIKEKRYDDIIKSFSKVIDMYVGYKYEDDIKQEIYLKLIEKWIHKTGIKSWKNYLFGCIKNKALQIIKYKYNYKHLSESQTKRLIYLNSQEYLTKEESVERGELELKRDRFKPLHFCELDNEEKSSSLCCEMSKVEEGIVDIIRKILNERDFDIFYSYVVKKDSLQYLGNKYGLTKEGVRLIIKKCKNTLKNDDDIKKYKDYLTF